MNPMFFQQLLAKVPNILAFPNQDCLVTAPPEEDSRLVQPGGIFVARRGQNTDSHRYIAQAIAAGAVAVVGELPPAELNLTIPYAQVADAQQILGHVAAAYHGYPSQKMIVIGVTGTDGKTTTTNLVYHILKAAGLRAGMISTISAVIGDQDLPTGLHVTTPSAPEVQAYLARMVASGLTHCVLETTSHGLAQGRVNGIDFDIAVLTNLTHEHLDFHGSFENYRAAKGLLFDGLAKAAPKMGVAKCAVVNGDDPNVGYFSSFAADKHLLYSMGESGLIRAQQVRYNPASTNFDLVYRDHHIPVESSLVGAFNVQNMLAAAGVAIALGLPIESIQVGIKNLVAVSGRMERIDEGQDFLAIVDFAHTPNALARALEVARRMTQGQVITVFGSAGLRDIEKRRLMAEVGVELADICILTAEDPRTESLESILEMMAAGARAKGGREGRSFYRVPDRGAALALACALAEPRDVVIVCGKGHEQSMAFGATEYPWDDREALAAALRGKPKKTLPTMRLDLWT
jgi:UDP-N-acetylmuramoyl-L-alanyl-D-glutamate--2,6-diaminopimelate ligase